MANPARHWDSVEESCKLERRDGCGTGNSQEEGRDWRGCNQSLWSAMLIQVGKGRRHKFIRYLHHRFASSCNRWLRDSISGLAIPAQIGDLVR